LPEESFLLTFRTKRLKLFIISNSNGRSWFNPDFPLGFAMMTEALFEAVFLFFVANSELLATKNRKNDRKCAVSAQIAPLARLMENLDLSLVKICNTDQ
jgi:hypothetical protein